MTRTMSKALMGAAALILMSQPVQAQDGDLWLQCRTTSDESWNLIGDPADVNLIRPYNYIRVVSERSIFTYSGTVGNMGDVCRLPGASCAVSDEAISFQFDTDEGTNERGSINRRTGELTVVERDRNPHTGRPTRTGRLKATCRRIEDPRPPAAF
jgi:hypothetical protein